jgi:hypothetical protein
MTGIMAAPAVHGSRNHNTHPRDVFAALASLYNHRNL